MCDDASDMFLTDISFECIKATPEDKSIISSFREFLDENSFIDMSEIIIMDLDIEYIAHIFTAKYINRLYSKLHINDIKHNIRPLRLDIDVTTISDKLQLLDMVEYHCCKILASWYRRNRKTYTIERTKIRDEVLDYVVSRAFLSHLYH